MTNKNFGKITSENNIKFASFEIRVNGHIVINPNADSYLKADDGPWLPVHDIKPDDKVGIRYIANGWEQKDGAIWRTYREEPIVAPPTVYIVEEIIYQLIAAQKLQATKAVVGDYWELLTMRDRIDATNPYWAEAFPQVCANLIATGVFVSQDEIDALLAKCRDGYEDEESGLEVR